MKINATFSLSELKLLHALALGGAKREAANRDVITAALYKKLSLRLFVLIKEAAD